MPIEPLLGPIKGMAQDFSRDALPAGFVWSLVDLIPNHQGGNCRSRNGWEIDTTLPSGHDPMTGAFGVFSDKRAKIVVTTTGSTHRLYEFGGGSSTEVGSNKGYSKMAQSPFFHRDKMIVPDGNGTAFARIVSRAGAAWVVADLPGTSLKGQYGCTYKDRVVLAAPATDRSLVAFSKPGDPTLAWNANSKIGTSLPLTGVFPLRSQVLCFHESSTERIRGDTPPDTDLSNPTGNMLLEPFPDRVGCMDARTIVGWRENVIFADERGIHMTDGATSTDLALGSMSLAWRSACQLGVIKAIGGVVGNWYIVTLHLNSALPSISGPEPGGGGGMQGQSQSETVTFLIDIPSRAWTRISNFPATGYISTASADDREKLFFGYDLGGAQLMADATPAIYPVFLTAHTGDDGDGQVFRPILETAYFPLVGPGRERIKNVYVEYELNSADPNGRVEIDIATQITSDQTEMDFETLGTSLPKHTNYKRKRIPVRRDADGFALRLRVEEDFKMFNFYGLEIEGWPRGQTYISRG